MLQYKARENNWRAGDNLVFSVQIQHTGISGFTQLAERIVQGNQTLPQDQVMAVLNALVPAVRDALLEGHTVTLDGLATMKATFSGDLTTQDQNLKESGGSLQVKTEILENFETGLTEHAEYERITEEERTPSITRITNISNKTRDTYTSGNIIEVVGDHLNFQIANEDEGIFVTEEGGQPQRLSTYVNATRRKVTALLLPVHGNLQVSIKVRYTTRGQLKVFDYPRPLTET